MKLLRRLRVLQLQSYLKNGSRPRIDNRKPNRDYWALGISCASLLISFVTLFFNLFLQRDHVSIVVNDVPEAIRANDGSVSLLVFFDPEITFINSGTRPAASPSASGPRP